MVTATHYMVERELDGHIFRIRNLDKILCPDCGAPLSGYDTRLRHIVSEEGLPIWFRLRRLRCPCCRRLHLEMPDFMRAGKHYTAAVIDAAVAGDITSCPADDSTIRRWRR